MKNYAWPRTHTPSPACVLSCVHSYVCGTFPEEQKEETDRVTETEGWRRRRRRRRRREEHGQAGRRRAVIHHA